MFRSSRTPRAPRGGRTRRRSRLTLQTLEDRTAPAAGPFINAQSPAATAKLHAPLAQFLVQFDQVMDVATFTPADVVSFNGPSGPIAVTSVAPTSGGGNRVFTLTFPSQGAAGPYTIALGPDIRDLANRPMDQNNNNIAGEDLGDRYTGSFQLYGPRVNFRIYSPSADGTVNQVLLQFQPSSPGINGATFNPDDVVIAGPNGPVTVTGVVPNPSRPNFEFFFQFAPQSTAGVYSFTVGPNIADTFGNLLDQNQDGIGGVAPGDLFVASFTVDPFRLTGMNPNSQVNGGSVSNIRVFFNRSVDLSTIDLTDVVSLTGPGGVSIPVSSITPVSGGSNRQFDLAFAPQSAIGFYTLVMGPNIVDVFGNGMDNNGNFTPHEVPGDRFQSSFSIIGPRITGTPSGGVNVSSTTVAFSQPMDPATFTLDDITLTGPSGIIPVTSVTPNPGNQSFVVVFPAQTTFGRYDWVVGPDIRNTTSVALDQNGNLIPGETPGDQSTSSFFISAPRIVGAIPSNNSVILGPVSKVTLTFDRDMNASTFTTADVVSFTDPNGAAIPVTVTAVNARTFDLTFTAQNTDGPYALIVGPDIRDTFGNPMNQDNDNIPGEDPGDRFTTSIQLNIFGPDPFFGYVARRHTWEDINLEPGQPGVFTILDNVDDAAAPVDLGTNTFNFYGQVYTGASQVFVNTNGMITFGSPTNQPNSNFQKSGQFEQLVAQPYIAAFYRDWTTSDSTFPDGAPSGAVLGKFEDTSGDGTPDRLIVEWSDLRNWISLSANRSVTFQAILDLNTGANTSPVTLNFVATQTLDPGVDNGNIVGIRPSGGLPTLLISPTNQFGALGFPPSPWVGPGKAMQFTAPPIGGTVRGAKFHDFDRDGARDPGEPGLAGWQVFLDENGNGALDTGEPTATTDADGNYEFTGVVPGTHVVREVVQPGWSQTRPGAGGTVVNGSFETGDLTGWTTIGYVENKAIHGVVPPADGTRQLFMWSGIAFGVQPAQTPALESFLGVAPGTLSAVTGTTVLQGAAVKQTVFATAGSSLTFNYNLLTGEFPLTARDSVFVTVAGDGGAVATNNARQLRGADPSGFSFMQSGYETFAFKFPTTGTYTIGIGVVDGAGGFGSSGLLLDNVRLIGDAFPVGVLARQTVSGKEFGNYTPPVASVTGPPSGVRGQGLSFTLGATDAYPPDQAAGFTFDIDWDGDDTFDQIVTGPDGLKVKHVYPTTGTYTVFVQATDQHGTVSELASYTIPIGIVELQTDPGDPSKTALAVGGTTGNDEILIQRNGSPDAVRVTINDTPYGSFAPTGLVIVYSQDGDDHVLVPNSVTLPTMIFGGDGNDQLDGGAGPNILIGGAGNDILKGGSLRDLLIGGTGADTLDAKGGDDLVIAGLTAFDGSEAALSAIMAEWSRSDQTYEDRVDHLRNGGGLNGSVLLTAATVSDDDDVDSVAGGSGRDWYFGRLSGPSMDLITDLTADEEVN
jgi:SdrD B-like domain/RTX calcium-binding nonapeptide repeat (4 copies)/Bacterial Ig-like domain